MPTSGEASRSWFLYPCSWPWRTAAWVLNKWPDRLTLYSLSVVKDKADGTQQPRVIHLSNLLPIQNPNKRLRLIGSVEGSDIISITTNIGIYEIKLRKMHWNKLNKKLLYIVLTFS